VEHFPYTSSIFSPVADDDSVVDKGSHSPLISPRLIRRLEATLGHQRVRDVVHFDVADEGVFVHHAAQYDQLSQGRLRGMASLLLLFKSLVNLPSF